MKKWSLLLVTVFVFFSAVLKAQTAGGKRTPTNAELKQLSSYCDSLLREMKRIYKLEKQENTPGKYQPQRIALVRSYLWIYQYLDKQLSVVAFSERDVIRILGRPNSRYPENDYEVFAYTDLDKPYLRLKNFNYKLIFKAKQLVLVKTNLQ
jgi:hypothetical protein